MRMFRTIFRRSDRAAVLGLVAVLVMLAPSLSFASSFTFAGTVPVYGQWPKIITAFANSTTGDIYPPGSGNQLYIFTLFDTGSDQVAVGDKIPTGGTISDADLLQLASGASTNIRINGMSAIGSGSNPGAPIGTDPGAPGGTYGSPQAEVLGINVSTPSDLDLTLIGAPVANNVIATIDYTKTITKGPYTFCGGCYVSGPDINFVSSASYTPSVQIALETFGTSGLSGDHNIGYRYFTLGTSFNEGLISIVSDTDANGRFLFDTGTNVTLIDQDMANSLGLTGIAPFTGTVGGQTLNGYYLDSITMTGIGGTYTIPNVPVLVGGVAPAYDAVIGSNLFDTTKILFDGPGSTLGIGVLGTEPAIPEPSTWVLMMTGLVGLGYLARKRKGTR